MMDNRPEYASYDSPRKFQAIQGIVGKRLLEHPNAILSYSGGSDSDTMLDIVERARKLFNIPPIKYAFFNTGLEMKATKDHVREQAEKYGITIDEYRPKLNIVLAVRKYGIPFRLRPLYYVTDEDKAWYKEYYGSRYSDAYEVYGFKRTGCCGCPISYRATQDLEVLKKYEPQVVKAAYNIFGKSYEYRAKYNEYKKKRRAEKKSLGTISMMEELNETEES